MKYYDYLNLDYRILIGPQTDHAIEIRLALMMAHGSLPVLVQIQASKGLHLGGAFLRQWLFSLPKTFRVL